MKLLETLLKHDACDDGILYYKNNHEYVDKILKRKHITVNDDDIFQYARWLQSREISNFKSIKFENSIGFWEKYTYDKHGNQIKHENGYKE